MPPKTQKEMVSEIYDLIVGTGDKEGMAEIQRKHCDWMKDHDAKHKRITQIVMGAISAAITSTIAAVVAWVKSRSA